ncbi:hypothetical protein PanWU01x14_240570 [Parasponia andersonii]|uniref:Uncharacterized protein n=1 Tax=Parasponia andersonii TaxID=3476 RepID=A0A2P5BGP0_PARAD|nr:hypothetical protein PanWU01x14_240570 [Parasponia andersonii]
MKLITRTAVHGKIRQLTSKTSISPPLDHHLSQAIVDRSAIQSDPTVKILELNDRNLSTPMLPWLSNRKQGQNGSFVISTVVPELRNFNDVDATARFAGPFWSISASS